MGIIQSIFCSITFCVERILTWTCCAFLLLTMMFSLIILMVYGISVGYHHAQKELATFALSADVTPVTRWLLRRMGDEEALTTPPVVRLMATDKAPLQQKPLLEMYRKKPEVEVPRRTSASPARMFVRVENDRPEEDILARKLISRDRRSRPNVTNAPFFRPLNKRSRNRNSVTKPATELFAMISTNSAPQNDSNGSDLSPFWAAVKKQRSLMLAEGPQIFRPDYLNSRGLSNYLNTSVSIIQ